MILNSTKSLYRLILDALKVDSGYVGIRELCMLIRFARSGCDRWVSGCIRINVRLNIKIRTPAISNCSNSWSYVHLRRFVSIPPMQPGIEQVNLGWNEVVKKYAWKLSFIFSRRTKAHVRFVDASSLDASTPFAYDCIGRWEDDRNKGNLQCTGYVLNNQ